MLSIISPAKSMNFDSYQSPIKPTTPIFMEYSYKLLQEVKKLSEDEIKKIMNVSDNIGKLNYDRFQNFGELETKEAFFAYDGDVYSNIDRDSLSKDNITFAMKHLRIISGLYGILKPLDYIKPYRLEMATKLGHMAPKGLALYWQEAITDELNRELSKHKNQCLVNLASNEYSIVVNRKKLAYPVIDIQFREKRDEVIKNIPINAKRARGQMMDFIIRNSIDHINDLKHFNNNGYHFDVALSKERELVFVKGMGI